MLVFYVKKPFLLKKAFFPKKNDPKMPFFQKKNFGPKNFFRPKMPKKPNFSIKKCFLGGQKGFWGSKWPKIVEKWPKTIFGPKIFSAIFGPFWTFLAPKIVFFTQKTYFCPK